MYVCMLVRNRLQNQAHYGDETFETLKDALADFTKPVDESQMHLYDLYQESSKKLVS